MNKIYVDVNFTKGTLHKKGIELITGDYASTEIEFTFDEEHQNGLKIFEMKSPSNQLVMVSEIINNKIVLTGEDDNENVSLFNEAGNYIFEISYYINDSKLTSVYGKLPVEKEQVEIDGTIVEPYVPLFEQLLQDVSSAITQANNLDIEASKEDNVATITITKKDGTTQEVEILDGEKGDKGDDGTSGITVFKIENGHLIATSEIAETLTNYSIVDGHLLLKIGE